VEKLCISPLTWLLSASVDISSSCSIASSSSSRCKASNRLPELFMTEQGNETNRSPDYMGDKFIAIRAYQFWEDRGKPFGSPDLDWFRAKEDIRREMTRVSGTGG